MTTYNFMPASKVADLDMMLVGIKDHIFGDLAGETLTEECLEELNEKFARVDEIIDSCKDRAERDVKEYEKKMLDEYNRIMQNISISDRSDGK